MIGSILDWVTPVLETTPVRWQQMAQKFPADLLSLPPAPNEWSAAACLQHLLDTERWVFPKRVEYFLAGQDFPAFHPEEEGTKPGGETDGKALANEFRNLRRASLQILARVKPEDLSRQARHQELGLVTLAEMLNEWAGHDLMHTVQAERALMQPFIRGCGPWKVYFRDHAV